jgi:hypothetical protein
MSRFNIKIGEAKHDEQIGIERSSPQSTRAIKVVTAISFHVVLHIISIHLAIAYTVFHVIQHRQDIASLVKKKAFRHNARPMHSLQQLPLAA